LAKVEAFEGFVTLNALGLLPVLSLELPKTIWADFPGWFALFPAMACLASGLLYSPCNTLAQAFFPQSPPSLLLPKLLAAKPDPIPNPDLLALAP